MSDCQTAGCGNFGDCLADGTCDCLDGFLGPYCNERIIDGVEDATHPVPRQAAWHAYRWLSFVLYVAAAMVCLVLIVKRANKDLLPVLGLSAAIGAALSRALWLAIDPWGMEGHLPPEVRALFANITYSFLVCAYSLVLGLWATMAGGKVRTLNGVLDHQPARWTVIVLTALTLPFGIVAAVLTRVASGVLIAFFAYLAIIAFSIGIVLTVSGLRIVMSMHNAPTQKTSARQQRQAKVAKLTLAFSAIFLLAVVFLVILLTVDASSVGRFMWLYNAVPRVAELGLLSLLMIMFKPPPTSDRSSSASASPTSSGAVQSGSIGMSGGG